METQEVLAELRKKNHLSQDEMAEKLFVTRQAVSRWETGETVPNIDSLKLISKIFGVSINTLLGQPRNTTCQVCGMPLKDEDTLSRDSDGSVNDSYCKWCWHDGAFHVAETVDGLIEDILPNMSWASPEVMREFLRKQLPTLEYWKNRQA